MRRSLATCIVSLFLCAVTGCSEDKKPTPLKSTKRFDPGALDTRTAEPGATFTDMSDRCGVDFVHERGAKGKKYLPETMGSGVGLFDYDNDGDLDVLFCQSRPWEGSAAPTPKLYRNDGDWKFTDVTAASGLAINVYGMGCTIADYDADGHLDVYLTCLGGNHLFHNDGGKRFTRVDVGPGRGPYGGTWIDGKKQQHPSWSTGAAWFDADGDGDLDLVVVSYVRWTSERDVYAELVPGIKSYTRPELYEGDAPRLYLQENGTFRDATKGSGFDATAVRGKSMAVCLDDFDGDGKLDVFVANDTVQNFLFLNRGGGKFRDVAVEAAVGYDDTGVARAGMGTDSIDYRNDGRPSLCIGNFSEEPVSLYSVASARQGTVLFEDNASSARIGTPTLLPLTFGLLMADLDLDGWCDLVLANGHIEPSVTKLKREVQYEQTPQLFRNLKGKRFADVSVDAGPPFARRVVGRGLAAGDLDSDGDIDLVLTANGGRPIVMRNDQTGGRALRIRLEQPGSKNRDAIGAIVRATAGGMTQRRVVRTGGSYLSHSERTLTFGLGGADAARVEITWPDGRKTDAGELKAQSKPHIVRR